MSESMIMTFSPNASTALLARTPKSQRKTILQDFGFERHSHVGVADVPVLTETWQITDVEYDTILLRQFIKSALEAVAESVVTEASEEPLESLAASHDATITEAAKSFIAAHSLQPATLLAVRFVAESFTDVHQVQLDLDPGDEEEDDHPWIRVYVQTGMNASATLLARKQFYKSLNAEAPREQTAYFHLAFRIVS